MIDVYNNTNDASPVMLETVWNAFISAVLNITAEAYEKMSPFVTKYWTKDWEEGNFSANLCEHIEKTIWDKGVPFAIMLEDPVRDQDLLKGKKKIIQAKRRDFRIATTPPSKQKVYFVFESKLISDTYQTVNRNLSKDYVTDGMARFVIQESYGDNLKEAGMIGYILSGTPESNAIRINKYVESKLSSGEQLRRQSKPLKTLDGLYFSEHTCRKSGNELQLHHLFMTFKLPD